MGALVAVSIICQLFGNVVFQWSLGIVGMALAVPLTLGMMIVAGAMMGRVFLHESVTIPMAISTAVLILAMCVLSLGASEASQTMAREASGSSVWLVLAGVGAALGSGIAYALLGVVIRYAVTDRISILLTLVSVTLTGVVVLGAASFVRIGWRGMLATAPRDWAVMLLAGFFNAVAFLALTRSLQLVPVVYVNALNATQATMAAVTGVLLFAERSSWALWCGVGLTGIGLIFMQKRLVRPRVVRQDAERGTVSDPATDDGNRGSKSVGTGPPAR
jgi:drug/metabolite transporter (DMT)-like permease